jgi:hypothetical protein
MNLHKACGEIANLRIVSTKKHIVFSPQQREAAGMSAIVFAAAGMGGAAIQTSMNADATADDVDLYSFEINDQKFAGCTRKATFKSGDIVEIVFQETDKGNEVLGVTRPATRSIWLYPYMSKGSVASWKFGLKMWVGTIFSISFLFYFFTLTISLLNGSKFLPFDDALFGLGIFSLAFSALMLWLSPKYFRFSRCADEVFAAFGFSNPKQIDLGKTSATYRKKHNIPLDWENKAELWY